MAWHDESTHPFAGIAEKLKRTNETISEIETEANYFFESSSHPVIPDPKVDMGKWQEAVDYHKNLAIPIRFGVLCGEVVHHLRSCLDHIAWHFSSLDYRRTNENAIAMPILDTAPKSKRESEGFERRIHGITNPKVRKIIEDLQPYHRGEDASNHPLSILHDLDRFDKHRELAIISSSALVTFSSDVVGPGIDALIKHKQGETLSTDERLEARRIVRNIARVVPQIAFAKFGHRKTVSVDTALKELSDAVIEVVDKFVTEL